MCTVISKRLSVDEFFSPAPPSVSQVSSSRPAAGSCMVCASNHSQLKFRRWFSKGLKLVLHHKLCVMLSIGKIKKRKSGSTSFFFLEYAGELHIIVLVKEK
jgi:hypothetical protein